MKLRTDDSSSTYYYYNTKDKIMAIYDGKKNPVVSKYECDRLPFIFMHYNNPLVSNTSTSIADLLYGIQMEIDQLLQKIEDASKLNPALTFFVPDGSTIKTEELDNRIGNIVKYKVTPNMTTSPVTVSTPAFIDPQYMQLLAQLKQDAYEAVGISQLSATSQKPMGLDSGKALQTMENIESGAYPQTGNVCLITRKDETNPYVQKMKEFILSEDGQYIIRQTGYAGLEQKNE